MNSDLNYPTAAPVRDAAAIVRFERIDREFVHLALRHQADELQFPILINKALLDRAEYPQAFPHLLMLACACCDPAVDRSTLFAAPNLQPQEWYLSPAVCYHVYARLSGQILNDPQVFTARGRCFRREETFEPGRRQMEFEMREIVLVGDPGWIQEKITEMQPCIDEIAATYSVGGHWETAEDPFFLPTAKGKVLMQRLLETKKELICDDPAPLAIASINRHSAFFGERFAIRLRDGTPAHTACLAFGLDRWTALPGSASSAL